MRDQHQLAYGSGWGQRLGSVHTLDSLSIVAHEGKVQDGNGKVDGSGDRPSLVHACRVEVNRGIPGARLVGSELASWGLY